MRTLILIATLMASINLQAQEVQCVEVPLWHKIVFVPKHIPVDQLIWKWNKARESTEWTTPPPPRREDPETGKVEEFIYTPCSEDLAVSPSICGEWRPVE